jgi:hypothetical protein
MEDIFFKGYNNDRKKGRNIMRRKDGFKGREERWICWIR